MSLEFLTEIYYKTKKTVKSFVYGDDNNSAAAEKTGNKKKAGSTTTTKINSSSTTNPAIASKPTINLVPEKSIEKPLDVAKIDNKSNQSAKSLKTNDEIKQLHKDIKKKCDELNINSGILSIKLAAITGTDFQQLMNKPSEIQKMLLGYVSESLDRVKNAKRKNVDNMQAVITDAAIMYKFITNDEKGNHVDLFNLSADEIKARREACDKKIKALRDERIAKINKLPESERAAAQETLENEEAEIRKHIFDNVSKKISFKNALELLLMLSVKDLGDAAEELMESYPLEIRKQIASTMHSFESFKEYINIAKGRGEDLGDEKAKDAWKKYNRIFGSYKDKESFKEYEEAYLAARQNGELPDEILKPTAMGIGEAAYTNHILTSEEKDEILKIWVSDNNGYLSDVEMAEVEQKANDYIQQYLEKHPDEKEKFQYATKTIKEIAETTLNREFKPNKEHSLQQSSSSGNHNYQSNLLNNTLKSNTMTVKNTEVSQSKPEPATKDYDKTSTIINDTLSDNDIKNIGLNFSTGKIDYKKAYELLGNNEHNFVLMCVLNPALEAVYNQRIQSYLKSEKDFNKRLEIAEHASNKIKAYVVETTVNGQERLLAELKKNGSSHDTIKILKGKMKEKFGDDNNKESFV